jgi:hypothetical protein
MDAKNSATSKSMCARALSETLEKLEALAPPEQLPDELDDLARRRAERRKESRVSVIGCQSRASTASPTTSRRRARKRSSSRRWPG